MPDRLHSTLHFIQADGIPSGLNNILYRVSCLFLFSLIFCLIRVRLRIKNRAAPRDDPTLAFLLYYVQYILLEKQKGQQVGFYYNYLKCVWITSFFDWVWLRPFLEPGN
jgi:hypothetical protein